MKKKKNFKLNSYLKKEQMKLRNIQKEIGILFGSCGHRYTQNNNNNNKNGKKKLNRIFKQRYIYQIIWRKILCLSFYLSLSLSLTFGYLLPLDSIGCIIIRKSNMFKTCRKLFERWTNCQAPTSSQTLEKMAVVSDFNHKSFWFWLQLQKSYLQLQPYSIPISYAMHVSLLRYARLICPIFNIFSTLERILTIPCI